MTEYADLATIFERFARKECEDSPLYQRLALGVAGDPELIALAAEGRGGPPPNLLLAAVHFLLLQGAGGPLAAFYTSLGGRKPPTGDLFPAFRAFCREHEDALRPILHTRRVQTNEVARAAVLMPVLHQVARREFDRPLALVEIGASAGLLLLWDRYRYHYIGAGIDRWIGSASSVEIACELAGEYAPNLPDVFPPIAARTGLDLHPIDVRDPAEVAWLHALVWPDQPERQERLTHALAVARETPPRLIGGDALQALPEVLAGLPAEAAAIVYHAHTLNQFSRENRQRVADILARHTGERPLYRIALEGRQQRLAEATLFVYRQGRLTEAIPYAAYRPHGGWLRWQIQT